MGSVISAYTSYYVFRLFIEFVLPAFYRLKIRGDDAISTKLLNDPAGQMLTPSNDFLQSRIWRQCVDVQGNSHSVLAPGSAPYIIVNFSEGEGEGVDESLGVYYLPLAEAKADALGGSGRGKHLQKRRVDTVQMSHKTLQADMAGVISQVAAQYGELENWTIVGNGEVGMAETNVGLEDMAGVWREVLSVQDGVFGVVRNETGLAGLRCPAGYESGE